MWAIHNRVRPNKNECDVVSEKKQFSSYNNKNYKNCCKNKCKNKAGGSQDLSENEFVQHLCQDYTFDGVDPIDGAEYFHDLSINTPLWIRKEIARNKMKEIHQTFCSKFRFYKVIN